MSGAALYMTNDLAFELPAGGFEDLTVHELEMPLPGGQALGLVIAREPLPPGTGLAEAVRAHVEAEGRRLPFHRLVEQRERVIAGKAAIEVIARWAYRGVQHHARAIHVADAGVRLVFSTSAPAEHQAACDTTFDRLVSTLTLGHP
jgi:hypothetical protein